MASEPGESPEDGLETFVPTGGRVAGVLGLVMAAGVVASSVVARDDVPVAVGAGALVAGVLAWAALLRPRVSVSTETLHLRNMLETVHVPLAAVDELVVRQVLMVRAGDKKFVSPAVGRTLRKLLKAPRPNQMFLPSLPTQMDDGVGPAVSGGKVPTTVDYVDHVEGRLRERIADARTRLGIKAYSDEAEALARDVRRQPAWPEILALVVTTVLFVLALAI